MKQINRHLRQGLALGMLVVITLTILAFTGLFSRTQHSFHTYDIASGEIIAKDDYNQGNFYGFSMYEFHGVQYRAFVEEVKGDHSFSYCFTNGPDFSLNDMRIYHVSENSIGKVDGTRGMASFVDSEGIINFLTVITLDDGTQRVIRFNRDGSLMEVLDFSNYGFKILNINAYDENSFFLLIKDINYRIIRYDLSSNLEVIAEFAAITSVIDFHVSWIEGSIDRIYLLQKNPNMIKSVTTDGLMQIESNLSFEPYDLAFDGANLVIHQKH